MSKKSPLPCKTDDLAVQCVDISHKLPEHQGKVLADPANLPHQADIKLGRETLDLLVLPGDGHNGDYIGVPNAFSAHQIQVVRETFAKIEPIAEQTAIVFYTRLFDLDLSLKAFFKSDILEQGRKSISILKDIISNLEAMENLVPIIKTLVTKHVAYGVKPAHYDTIAFVLMWTLEQSLGEAFTPEVEDAWGTVYETLTTTMKHATDHP